MKRIMKTDHMKIGFFAALALVAFAAGCTSPGAYGERANVPGGAGGP